MNMELDLHNETIEMAKLKIQRFVIKMLEIGIHYFEIIHGYNRGTRIKEFLSDIRNIQCKKIHKMYPDPLNEGRTMVWLKY